MKTVLDRADYTDLGCHNSIRPEAEHFLNTLALTFISFLGCFVFLCKNIIFSFASDPLVNFKAVNEIDTLKPASEKI